VPTLHTLEHLGATVLRSHPCGRPAPCTSAHGLPHGTLRAVRRRWDSAAVLPAVREMFEWIAVFPGTSPGAAPPICGNWRAQNPDMARWEAARFLECSARQG
jgi:S-ribosylhomocysteine lyase